MGVSLRPAFPAPLPPPPLSPSATPARRLFPDRFSPAFLPRGPAGVDSVPTSRLPPQRHLLVSAPTPSTLLHGHIPAPKIPHVVLLLRIPHPAVLCSSPFLTLPTARASPEASEIISENRGKINLRKDWVRLSVRPPGPGKPAHRPRRGAERPAHAAAQAPGSASHLRLCAPTPEGCVSGHRAGAPPGKAACLQDLPPCRWGPHGAVLLTHAGRSMPPSEV